MEDNLSHKAIANRTLGEQLKDVNTIPFHMPGHKRVEKDYLYGAEIDFTETGDTDNLHDAKGILRDSMRFAAAVFGVKESRFLVNGSTVGILAGLRTLTKRGDTVLVARNCHKSVINAVEVLGLVPEYVMPTYIDCGFYGSVLPKDIESRLVETGAKTVVITSPTYEGIISDVKQIAEVCHRHGATLFVDEAHGAHLGLSSAFPKSARTLGADLVVNSLHKTLASLTQTAVLNVCTDKVNISRLDESLAIFETSSPSYVLMSSIDECIKNIAMSPRILDDWACALDDLRACLKDGEIALFDISTLTDDERQKVFDYDKSKLVFLTDGVKLADVLRKDYNVELEMASKNYAIAMTGAGDTKENFDALKSAIYEMGQRRVFAVDVEDMRGDAILAALPKKAFNPCEIDSLSVEYVNIDDITGRVSAENIWAYPPGAPIIVKGETVDEKTLAYIKELLAAGVNVSSSLKDFPRTLAVVKSDNR